jgi:hypothetical protein
MKNPPPTIAGLYVLAFANVDETVQFKQLNRLNVGGKWLGRVPNLAICKPFDKQEFMVQHGSECWESLGIASGFKSVIEAKESTERSYNGISEKWKLTHNSIKEEKARYEAGLKATSCSFCGRTILQITAMVGDEVRICNHCIKEFHEAIHLNDDGTNPSH